MNVEFARSANPAEAPAISLKEVYYLKSDRTYHAYKGADKSLSGYVIIRTVSGNGRIRIQGLPETDLKPASLLAVKYDSIIDYHPFDNEWEFWWFAFDLDGLLLLPLNEPLILPGFPKEQSLMRNCLSHLQYVSLGSQLLASSCMALLLGCWTRHSQIAPPSCHKSSLDDLLRYIHSHLGEAMSVSNMAKMCCLSSRQLYNVFRQVTHMNPTSYILRLRMEKSSYLLLNTNQPVAVIACALGYSDPLYFSRVFKAFFGISPQIYRKQQGKIVAAGDTVKEKNG